MYKELFVNSILRLGKYDLSFHEIGQSKEELLPIFEQNQYVYNQEPLVHFEALVIKLCKEYVGNIPSKHITNACHAICQGFNDAFDASANREQGDLDITIGNVFYKNRNIYQLTENKLDSLMSDGFQSDKELPLHVWLTLPNLTVIDLTIIPTLLDKGEVLTPREIESNIIIWKENDHSNFRYEPLLVDNSFMHRVDKIAKVVANE